MSDNHNAEREDIEVRHTYPEEYELYPATGVTGGTQPQGDMKIDFVYDHDYRTKKEFYHPEEGFITGIEINGHLEREHKVGVSMRPEQARDTAVWILKELLGDNISSGDIYSALADLVE